MATKEVLTETREGVEYDLSAVKHGKPAKGVGFAPTKTVQGETSDDQLEWLERSGLEERDRAEHVCS